MRSYTENPGPCLQRIRIRAVSTMLQALILAPWPAPHKHALGRANCERGEVVLLWGNQDQL